MRPRSFSQRAASLGRACALVCAAAVCACTIDNVLAADAAAPANAKAPCEPQEPIPEAVVPRRPGALAEPTTTPVCRPDHLPPADVTQLPPSTPVPDRWRLVEGLGYPVNWADPYSGSNPLKGDRPVGHGDRFVSLGITGNSLAEGRRIPVSSSVSATDGRTAISDQLFFNQTVAFDAVAYRGDTVFRPPQWQWRITPVVSYSGTQVDGQTSTAALGGVQAFWFEKYLHTASPRYDFDSVRLGIQPLTSDFRGFLLSDQPVALRFFGTRSNNRVQYNVAVFRRLQKNAVRLNDVSSSLPDTDAGLANLYWQDFPWLGVTSEVVGAYVRNRAPGTQQLIGLGGAPSLATHDYDVGYLGFGFDGRLGRLNLTAMFYGSLGRERQATFTGASARVAGWFAAGELSLDSDWRRWRLSLLHSSGDPDPDDDRAQGFDNLIATPVFAGTDSSYFLHQQLTLSSGAFNLKARDAMLPALRPAVDNGQANFTNPGLDLVGIGLDCDLSPRWRVSLDANQLWLDQPAILATLSGNTALPNRFGAEVALNSYWRPFTNQNLIVRLSASMLLRGPAYQALYAGGDPYSVFAQLVLSY